MNKLSTFGNIICYFSSKRIHFITFTEEKDHILVLTLAQIDGHLLNEIFFHLKIRYVVLRPCDTDTYFRNIIFSNISEILFMCITDYFKLFSRSRAIKTLSKEFELE